jgi:bifunctional UDP-N-acetylglucosamine pyrophosphorylase / glucosamine-1-phosphate N-acetyltransferase
MSFNIIILAAGNSSRMNSSLWKTLHQIAQRPILSYVIETAVKMNPSRIILVTAPNMDEVRDLANSEYDKIYHAIQKKAKGTADAVNAALEHVPNSGKSIIIYGDTPFITEKTLRHMANHSKDIALLGFYSSCDNQYGRLITYDENLLRIVEYLDATDEEKAINYCNSGIYIIKNSHLHKLLPLIKNNNSKKEFYLTDIIKIATQHDITCSILNIEEQEVMGINNRKELSIAEESMQERLKHNLMNHGVTFISPNTSYVSYDTIAESDVTIHPNVFIGKNVKLGKNVVIKSFCHIEGAIIQDNSIIGPFARIRPNTHIKENVKIGNFVEVKNSYISEHSKINHLSYIGDAEIGSSTNIGAGTITCNFDGIKTKSKTFIGHNVAVGANSCLVAPVNIADNAFIAAGSVITKNVEENDLAFARARQVNLKSKGKRSN